MEVKNQNVDGLLHQGSFTPEEYVAPKLSLIGEMCNLTSGGSGGKRESSGSSSKSKSSSSKGKGKRYGGLLFPRAQAGSSDSNKRP